MSVNATNTTRDDATEYVKALRAIVVVCQPCNESPLLDIAEGKPFQKLYTANGAKECFSQNKLLRKHVEKVHNPLWNTNYQAKTEYAGKAKKGRAQHHICTKNKCKCKVNKCSCRSPAHCQCRLKCQCDNMPTDHCNGCITVTHRGIGYVITKIISTIYNLKITINVSNSTCSTESCR